MNHGVQKLSERPTRSPNRGGFGHRILLGP
jgi:hypothetical protein